MTTCRPILRENPDERVRTLLSSAQLDVPPSGWAQRVLLAAAPAAGLPSPSDPSHLGMGGGAGATAAVAPTLSSEVAKAIAIKWAAIGAIAGGSLSATVMHAVDSRSEPHPVVTSNVHRQGTTASSSRVEAPSMAPHQATLEPTVTPVPKPGGEADPALAARVSKGAAPSDVPAPTNHTAPVARRAATVVSSRQKEESPSAEVTNALADSPEVPRQATSPASLGEEVRSLHRIRQVSAERGAVAALAALARHERQYPMPSLGIEAAVLRLDLLWSAGQKPAARTLAEKFLLANPDCPHAEHGRSLLGQGAVRRESAAPAP